MNLKTILGVSFGIMTCLFALLSVDLLNTIALITCGSGLIWVSLAKVFKNEFYIWLLFLLISQCIHQISNIPFNQTINFSLDIISILSFVLSIGFIFHVTNKKSTKKIQ